MKTILLVFVFTGIFCLGVSPASNAAVTATPFSIILPQHETIIKKISALKLKDIKKILGRKLTLKEKAGFLVLKHKLKRAPEESSKGHTAMVFGILALGLFVVGLFVPYVILGALVASIVAIVSGSVALRANKKDGKAFAGKLMGWITLGLIALLFILALTLIATIF